MNSSFGFSAFVITEKRQESETSMGSSSSKPCFLAVRGERRKNTHRITILDANYQKCFQILLDCENYNESHSYERFHNGKLLLVRSIGYTIVDIENKASLEGCFVQRDKANWMHSCNQ
jgi:hypothetical protein